MRLLLVDDDPVFLDELSELLTGEGHGVSIAPSAVAALDRLGHERFDVLLTDLKMPRHSGTQLLRAVHRHWPATLTVILTGQPEDQSAADALELEAFNYIPKPFRFDVVRATLDLAQSEIAFRDRLCRPRAGAEVRSELESAPPEGRVVLAPHGLFSTPAALTRELDLGAPESLGEMVRSSLNAYPSPRVLLAAPGELLRRTDIAVLSDAVQNVRAAIAPSGRLLVGIQRDAVSDGALVSLRWSLTGDRPRRFQGGLAGPRRRTMLRELANGPLDGSRLAERVGIHGAERIRFYLRYLARAGLVKGDEPSVALTDLGRAALEFLDEVERLGPRTARGDLLFDLPTDAPLLGTAAV